MDTIETPFDGYRCRSRLEARWVVFFKTLGIKFWYEPNGYEHKGVRYLPDFFLPQVDMFAEVKPVFLNDQEIRKARVICKGLGKSVEHRLFSSFSLYKFHSEEEFTAPYRKAVHASREARFEEDGE